MKQKHTKNTDQRLWFQKHHIATSLMVQWLRLHTFIAGGMCSIPDHTTKILLARHRSKKSKKKKMPHIISCCSKDIDNGERPYYVL